MKTKIYFWGGYTNHLYELTKSMSSLGYKVVIVLFDDFVKRNERIPTDVSNEVSFVTCKDCISDFKIIASQTSKQESLHINSGLKNSHDAVHHSLKWLLANGYDVFSLPQESFQLQGLKGKLNYFKWFYYLNFTFRRKIKAFGVTGLRAYSHLRMMSVKSQRLFQFMYVTKDVSADLVKDSGNRKRFIFVGAIDRRKNIIPFVEFMKQYPNQNFEFDIYGSWNLDAQLAEIVKVSPNIRYHGKKDYDTVRKSMFSANYLVLPSLYDGWGAVGNEGLQAGCKLLLSEECGCSIFVKCHTNLGYLFTTKDKTNKSLKKAVDSIFDENLDKSQYENISKWAKSHISPNAVAEYLDLIIQHYFNNCPKPKAPWT